MSSERLKAAAYDEIANLAVTTKTKLLRASETADRNAILNDYFQQSVMSCGGVGWPAALIRTKLLKGYVDLVSS